MEKFIKTVNYNNKSIEVFYEYNEAFVLNPSTYYYVIYNSDGSLFCIEMNFPSEEKAINSAIDKIRKVYNEI